MSEATGMSEAVNGGFGIWKETKGTGEVRREVEAEREKNRKLLEGLARCPVCGGEAEAVIFGKDWRGVWVGCDRSDECCRYIEIHSEGWSVEEVAADWNRYNSGIFRVIRRLKHWFRERFGAISRAERAEKKRRMAEIEEERAKRERIFGVGGGKRERRRWKVWLKGNK